MLEWLNVIVTREMTRKSIAETDSIEALDDDGYALKQERSFPAVRSCIRHTVSKCGKKTDSAAIDGSEGLKCQWNELVRCCERRI